MKYFLIALLPLFIFSCSDRDKHKTIISGLIQNPTHDNIYISKGAQMMDTIFLKEDGSFSSTFTINKPQLMVFKHPPEYQTFFVQPGDSLSFRLNTLDFDESLVYSGDSSAENNFLMDMYLMNEANNELILSYYKIAPDVFIDKTDSIKSERINKLEALNRENDFSDKFLEIAQKSINYEFYDIRERYAFLLKKYFPKKAESITDHFFDYRSAINFSDADLISHFVYLRFLDDYLKNESVNHCISHKSNAQVDCFDLNSFNNIHLRLQLVDSIFKQNDLKKKFLERFFAQEFVYASTKEQLKSALQLLEKADIDKRKKKELKLFGKFHEKFTIGQKIGNLPLKNHNEDTVRIENFTDKPFTAIHVWSSNNITLNQNRFNLINQMRKEFKNVNFIGINIDYNNYKLWQKNVNEHHLLRGHELQALNTQNSNFYNYYLNRFTLINQNGKVIAADVLKTQKDIKDFIVRNTQKKSLNK